MLFWKNFYASDDALFNLKVELDSRKNETDTIAYIFIFKYFFVNRTLLKQGPLGRPIAKRVLIVTPGSLVKVDKYIKFE